MSKHNEQNYIRTVVEKDHVSMEAFNDYLMRKPYSDQKCWEYLADIAQILSLLPPHPARLLDLGCGSGWTTEIFARCGYDAHGVDISPDFIALAKSRIAPMLQLQFTCHDYEDSMTFGLFDCAVIFDALHHADDAASVIQRAGESLRSGGTIVILEPGAGHSKTADSLAVMAKYGTTEKDMPYSFFKPFLVQAGFVNFRQLIRTRMLTISNLDTNVGPYEQIQHLTGLVFETALNGLSSLVVAQKG
jgi:SAM-dependent methyltransferase